MTTAHDIRRQSIEDAVNQAAMVGQHEYIVTYIGGTCDIFTDPVRLLRQAAMHDWRVTEISATRLDMQGL